MKGLKLAGKITKIIFTIIFILLCLWLLFYTLVLPKIISSRGFINFIEYSILKMTGAELTVSDPILSTGIAPKIKFSVKEISLRHENENLLLIENFHTELDYSAVFKKTISFKFIGLEYLFADIEKITSLLPPSNNNKAEKKPSPIKFDILNSRMAVKYCEIVTALNSNTRAKIIGKDICIEEHRNPKFIRFRIDAFIVKDDKNLKISLDDNDRVFINDKKLVIENCPLDINKSRININSSLSEDNFVLSLVSDNFDIADGADLLASDIIINNGSDILAETSDIKGTINFIINLNKNGLEGAVDVKKSSFKLKSLANMPVNVNGGKIKISPDAITLSNFTGYYSNSENNSLTMEGKVEDYNNSIDTKLVIRTIMTNDFTHNYLSKLAGCNITMTGDTPAGTRIEVYSKYNDIDVVYMARLAAGNDILIEGASLSPADYDRAIKAEMHLSGNILNIETIKYFIAQEINKDSKIKPLLTLHGNIDLANNSNILNLGFDVPKPLPSEFLNVLIGQKLFKKGKISGSLEYDNTGKAPILSGNLNADKVLVPSMRLFIKNGSFTADNKYLHINSEGKFHRSDYSLTGNIVNEMLFPIVVKDINLTLQDIDIEKILFAVTAAPPQDETSAQEQFISSIEANSDEADDTAITFIPNILIIEKGTFNLAKGRFKDIEFGNLEAAAALDKNGNLKIDSNKFDFAQGYSTAKLRCDLANNIYKVRLGVKDIDSDTTAAALLQLKREITGKASGLIEISTDASLKLNGLIKFAIFDGTIQKVGLVEYALNFVSIFRNPLAMISPSMVFDIVNIPEGKFDKISGSLEIKDNIIEKIQIQSTAPQLATLIMGRFDLESRDASLRIYTKFTNKNKGLTGVLRRLSLSSLANRVSLGASSSENYYAAELGLLPALEADEKDCQVFLTTVDGDVEHNNFLSALKKIK